MKTLAVVVIGIALLAVVQGATQCDKQKFDQASDAFAKELGLPGKPSDVKALLNAMFQLVVKQGLEGQKKICTAFKNLNNTLGDQYDSCFSVAYLKSIGVKPIDASAIVVLAAQQNFICTTGWEVIATNGVCLGTTIAKHWLKMQICGQTYGLKIAKDLTKKCQYTQEFIDCLTDPFKQACDPSLAATICQGMKVGYDIIFPDCSIKCSSA